MIKTGIFGGSFNPIHCGHVALAKQILQTVCLDEIWFMVSPLNPFKQLESDLLDDNLRLEMTQLALQDEDRLAASDFEFHLPRPSYMWNTLQALSHSYPERTFSLLIGADNWVAFDRWYHATGILSHYHIIVYPREGSKIDASVLPHNVQLVQTPLYPFSSTKVRDLVRQQLPIDGLIPQRIIPLVQKYYSTKIAR